MKRLVMVAFAIAFSTTQPLNAARPHAGGRHPRPAHAPPSPQAAAQDSAGAGPQRQGATGREGDGVDEAVRTDTNLILVPTVVTDGDGKDLPDLKREDFLIEEDGVRQEIAFFSTAEKPVTVFLVLDRSPSMRRNVRELQADAISFIEQLRPADRVVVITFAENVEVLSGEATADREALREAIRRVEIGHATRLYDAVDRALSLSKAVSGRKAIVLLGDGEDRTSSKANFENTLKAAEESEAPVYTVQYDIDLSHTPSEHMPRYLRMLEYPRLLSEKTGGQHFKAAEKGRIAEAFASAARELGRQYVLGYYPNPVPEAGQRRRIEVRVNRVGATVRARQTYVFVPSGGEVKK